MALKRTLLIGGAALAAAGGVGYLARRAVIHTASVLSVLEGNPPEARVVWSYGDGSRPLSLIIDLVAGSGASGSITVDGETTEATIPLSFAFSGPYSITATATYRLLGLPNTTVRTFAGNVAVVSPSGSTTSA